MAGGVAWRPVGLWFAFGFSDGRVRPRPDGGGALRSLLMGRGGVFEFAGRLDLFGGFD